MADGHSSKSLDLTQNGRGVWLIKVPKYIANRWDKAPGNVEVGKLRIAKISGSKPQVSLLLPDAVVNGGTEKIPKMQKMEVSPITQQTLGILSQTKQNNGSRTAVEERVVFEGKVVQRLECKPTADKCYMKLKFEEMKKAAIPARQTIQLENNVQNYKPVTNHRSNIEFAERKKAEGKNIRSDKEVVLKMLFKAFGKHQYYSFIDLVKITKQPVGYLKEILNEYYTYNRAPPHRNTWELKKENRHYNKNSKMDTADSDFTSDSD